MKTYYHTQFKKDLLGLNLSSHNIFGKEYRFFGGRKWDNCQSDLAHISPENKAKFILSLFITISVDQAFYTYLSHEHYSKAESLLQYPKFGWCGMGPHNEPPKYLIIRALEDGHINSSDIIPLIDEAIRLYVDEVVDFQQNHFPQLRVKEFFLKFINDRDVISYRESIVYEKLHNSLINVLNRLNH
jgi:hypothetical protein